jgi:hypothetical protein
MYKNVEKQQEKSIVVRFDDHHTTSQLLAFFAFTLYPTLFQQERTGYPEYLFIQIMGKDVFFEISIGGAKRGRIIFHLFDDVVPRTADNFRSLCTGIDVLVVV